MSWIATAKLLWCGTAVTATSPPPRGPFARCYGTGDGRISLEYLHGWFFLKVTAFLKETYRNDDYIDTHVRRVTPNLVTIKPTEVDRAKTKAVFRRPLSSVINDLLKIKRSRSRLSTHRRY